MREILFRGKRLDNGEWVEGDLLHPDIYGNSYSIEDFTKGKNNCFEIDPQTVGQWTGLVDKNGVKIFEGDIVRDIDGTLLVCWDEEKAAFVIRLQEYPYETLYLEEMWEDNEVIGSIHDKAVEE